MAAAVAFLALFALIWAVQPAATAVIATAAVATTAVAVQTSQDARRERRRAGLTAFSIERVTEFKPADDHYFQFYIRNSGANHGVKVTLHGSGTDQAGAMIDTKSPLRVVIAGDLWTPQIHFAAPPRALQLVISHQGQNGGLRRQYFTWEGGVRFNPSGMSDHV